MNLESKTAIVTDAGQGIGKAVALAFAREGAGLVLTSRTLPEVEATAREVGALGRRVLALKADVSRCQDVKTVVTAALSKFGRIDILVNNAAVQPPIGPLWENDPDDWLRTVLVSLGSVFLCCRAVVPAMIEQGHGKIINLSRGGAALPLPSFSAHAASNAAIVRLTETLAEELEGFDIEVNAVALAAVATGLTDEILAPRPFAGEELTASTRWHSETAGVPLERAAALAVFLASEESGGLTGRLISPIWDDWRGAKERIQEILPSDTWTLRRIHLLPRSSASLRYKFYEQDFGSETIDGYDILKTPRVKKVLRIARQRRARRLLDIGCGDGTISLKLAEVTGSKEVFGVDVARGAVRLARQKGIRALDVDLDEEDLPFPSDHFDLVFCGEVIEHLFDAGRLLKETHRVLRPGGTLIITTPNLGSWYNRLALLLGFQPWNTSASLEDVTAGKFLGKTWAEGGCGHLRVITLRALKDLLLRLGFTPTKFYGAPSAHPLEAMSLSLKLPVSLLQRTIGHVPSLATHLIGEAIAQKRAEGPAGQDRNTTDP